MNENLKKAIRMIAADEKLLDKFKGIGNPETIKLFKSFKDLEGSENILIDDLIKLFDDYHEGEITTEDIFGTDMCSQATDGTCGLTDRPCAATK
jgi:hypothetical protein